jgi:hypothetical protein
MLHCTPLSTARNAMPRNATRRFPGATVALTRSYLAALEFVCRPGRSVVATSSSPSATAATTATAAATAAAADTDSRRRD